MTTIQSSCAFSQLFINVTKDTQFQVLAVTTIFNFCGSKLCDSIDLSFLILKIKFLLGVPEVREGQVET